MDSLRSEFRNPLTQYLLSVADDKFILGHRNSDWTGLAPILEEDIAFSSLAQDEISHASALYEFIAKMNGGNANQLAYGRPPTDYRCAQLVELSDLFDWATALVRNFLCDHFDFVRLTNLASSRYKPLAELAGRLAAEERIHVEHVDSWCIRLGNGGVESNHYMQQGMNRLLPFVSGLFEPTDELDLLVGSQIVPRSSEMLYVHWKAAVDAVAKKASLLLSLPETPTATRGGRSGVHSPEFPALIDELTEVYRVEPEASW